jgi:ABC-type amino acid transport substrate-binding protein
MKKLLTLLLAGAMVLSLAACGGSGSDTTSETTEKASGGESYIIATDTAFAPFEFTDENNEFVGIDVDLMNAIAEDQGFTVEWRSLGFDAAMAAVEAGQADGCIAGTSITEKRKETYDFSDAYYDSYVCMAVAEDSDIAGFEDLKGKKVVVKTGTMGAECAESLKNQYGYEISYLDQSDMMYQDVVTGNTVACFEDQPVMAFNCQKGIGLKIVADQKDDYSTPYGFVVLKGQNQELLEKFNTGLANLKANGKYDEIIAKYTGTN